MSDQLYQAIFDISKVLELPVVIAALLSLAWVIYESGAFLMEIRQRFRRSLPVLAEAAASSPGPRSTAATGQAQRARSVGSPGAARCQQSSPALLLEAGGPGAEPRIAKELADFDFSCQRRLGRTRLLVRLGARARADGHPDPLSPALEGLANGNVQTLTDNLRVAFSITVLGLLVGAVAFALSLARDRIYGTRTTPTSSTSRPC